ncbi:MAG: purine nucleosidase [Kosmotogales bacterium]|nr:purine nucleosidase [Kosmotogales bacterium]
MKRKIGILVIVLLVSVVSTFGTQKVILDTDFGSFGDDAQALFILLAHPEVELLGITIAPGNVWLENGIANALRDLEIIDRTDIPVIPGAAEPLMGSRQEWLDAEQKIWGNVEYMGAYSRQRPDSWENLEVWGKVPSTSPVEDITAVEFMAEQIKKYPNEVTIIELGACTNLALLVREHPDVVPLVKQVFYMGGAIDIRGNTNTAAEFNFWYDPEAAHIAISTPWKRQVMFPLDVCEITFYTKEQYDKIVEPGVEGPVIDLFKQSQGNRFESNPENSSFVWDVMVGAYLVDPTIVKTSEMRYVYVDYYYGPNYGRSLGFHESRNRDFANPENFPANSQLIEVVYELDEDAFWDVFIDAMRSYSY